MVDGISLELVKDWNNISNHLWSMVSHSNWW